MFLRTDDINRHLFIEASAGTGKTYTIEHLFIRRLLMPFTDGSFCSPSQIAIVTFTRACAHELHDRIVQALQKTHDDLQHSKASLDFLLEIQEKGKDAIDCACRLLAQAKASFLTEHICTIHGFCKQLLTDHQGEIGFAKEEDIQKLLYDYFSLEKEKNSFSHPEMYAVLKEHGFSQKKLIHELHKALFEKNSEKPFFLSDLQEAVQKIPVTEEEVFQRLIRLSASYTGLVDRNGTVHTDVEQRFQAFSKLFSKDFESCFVHPLFFSELFVKRKVKSKDEDQELEAILQKLEPIIVSVCHPKNIFLRLKDEVQRFVLQELRKRKLFVPDELIRQTEELLSSDDFKKQVQAKYKVVFVDEFQDTDAVQWKIFSTLFLDSGYLYAVGDPKQSIYGFRKADVYSYLEAKEVIGKEKSSSLTTNFRSDPPLISVLNTLFFGEHSKSLFFLPKTMQSLDFECIQSSRSHEKKETIACEFFVAKSSLGRKKRWPHEAVEDEFFTSIANEIITLKAQDSSVHIAVLVHDRFQGERLEKYLQEQNLSVLYFRKNPLANTEAFHFLQRLIRCIESPRDKKALSVLLAHFPFHRTDEYLKALQNDDYLLWAEYVDTFYKLRDLFYAQGITSCIGSFVELEKISATDDFYLSLEQLIEILSQEKQDLHTLSEIREFLESLQETISDEFTTRIPIKDHPVTILTTHKSKGLEFDVVFALGAASRTKQDTARDLFEQDAEKIRMFYVACTRAKKKLYIPIGLEISNQEIEVGTASSVELALISHYCKDDPSIFSNRAHVYSKITSENISCVLDGFQKLPYISIKETSGIQPKKFEEKPIANDEVSEFHSITAKHITIHSFSSLVRARERHFYVSKKQDEKIPTGAFIGSYLHEIFQELLEDPKKVETKSSLSSFMQERLKNSPLQEVAAETSELFFTLFHAKILPHISLKDIDPKKCFREVEFLLKDEDQFIRGSIDTAFEYEGKYYIIDLKTHALEEYSEAFLKEYIQKEQYDIQARIYSKAFEKHLENSSISKDLYAGFLFIFLRGVHKDSGTVFFEKELICK